MDASGQKSRHRSSSRSRLPGSGNNSRDKESNSKYENKHGNKQDKARTAEWKKDRKKKKDAELPPNKFRCWCRECKCREVISYRDCYCNECGRGNHQGRLRKTPKPR